MTDDELPPILAGKRYDSPSAFTPESLLREARRQKSAEGESYPLGAMPQTSFLLSG